MQTLRLILGATAVLRPFVCINDGNSQECLQNGIEEGDAGEEGEEGEV